MPALVLAFFATAIALSSSACSSKPVHEQLLSKIEVASIRLRRPMGDSAGPRAEPGGIDYQSDPLPDKNFDCTKPETLLEKIPLKPILECFTSLQKSNPPVFYLYSLELSQQPEYKLEWDPEDEKTKSLCLAKVLPSLPVPREILYIAHDGDQRNCFASRLPVEKGEFMGIKMPGGKQALRIDFPLPQMPINEDELRRTLASWMLSPYFHQEVEGYIKSGVVTYNVCQKCYNTHENPLKEPKQPPVVWP